MLIAQTSNAGHSHVSGGVDPVTTKARNPARDGYRAGVTLGLDILLLSVDPDLQIVREREYTGYAMRAADLIELAVARRVETQGRWSKWIHVLDARPTGEPLLDASLASLATSPKRVDATGWVFRQPGRGAVTDGLALLEAQAAVRLYSRRLNSRLTLIEPALLDPGRQAQVRARLDRFTTAGDAADVLDWALAGLVHECDLWTPGHYDRAARRVYKEAARGKRGTDPADPVEATIRGLMHAAHNARNMDP
jgi:Golgi phosphoprotein 3 (GPP34)